MHETQIGTIPEFPVSPELRDINKDDGTPDDSLLSYARYLAGNAAPDVVTAMLWLYQERENAVNEMVDWRKRARAAEGRE